MIQALLQQGRSAVRCKESGLQPSRRQADLAASEADSQSMVRGAQSGVDEAIMEGLVESRYASLERLVAMQVMFYHMAARVAAFWYAHIPDYLSGCLLAYILSGCLLLSYVLSGCPLVYVQWLPSGMCLEWLLTGVILSGGLLVRVLWLPTDINSVYTRCVLILSASIGFELCAACQPQWPLQWLPTSECPLHTCCVVILSAGAGLKSHATKQKAEMLLRVLLAKSTCPNDKSSWCHSGESFLSTSPELWTGQQLSLVS